MLGHAELRPGEVQQHALANLGFTPVELRSDQVDDLGLAGLDPSREVVGTGAAARETRMSSPSSATVFFESSWNDGSLQEQSRDFDNIVVSTQPIGCL
jgi:hypothetical protein